MAQKKQKNKRNYTNSISYNNSSFTNIGWCEYCINK